MLANAESLIIRRQHVASTDIASIGFDELTSTMDIEFCTGKIYRYRNVPAKIFEQLRNAESKGRYFSRHVLGRFEFQRLPSPAL